MCDPALWGLSDEAIDKLGNRLLSFYDRYAWSFRTQTRDTSHYGFSFLCLLLRLKGNRNFTVIGRMSEQSSQNIQHFMSNSPWSATELMKQVRQEIGQRAEFSSGGTLLLDESADEKSSDSTVGAGRQYNGRLGKIEMSQVGVFLGYLNQANWLWVDGELFLPEAWFSPKKKSLRERLGLDKKQKFATKIELGWRMIKRLWEEGFEFEAVACDTLYGRSSWLRKQIAGIGKIYVAEVPVDTRVYLKCPQIGVPQGCRTERVLNPEEALEARQVARLESTQFERIRVRQTERGYLEDEFSAVRVWTVEKAEAPVQEWLIIRRESTGQLTCAVSNAVDSASLAELADLKCRRHFIECSNQEAKKELGWDERQSQKYTAWWHQLGLTILAMWFLVEMRLDWQIKHHRAADLGEMLGVEAEELPRLSVANLRELLRAALPLRQLSKEDAKQLVAEHLTNRALSRKSRIKTNGYGRSPT